MSSNCLWHEKCVTVPKSFTNASKHGADVADTESGFGIWEFSVMFHGDSKCNTPW